MNYLSSIIKGFVAEVIMILFVILFVYAATSKLIDHENFLIQLNKSPILFPFSKLIVWIVPLLEILLSVMLFIKKTQLVALYATFSLMTLFTGYIVVILNLSEYIPCSCGGVLENLSWQQHLIFNIFSTFFAAIAVLSYPEIKKEIIAQ